MQMRRDGSQGGLRLKYATLMLCLLAAAPLYAAPPRPPESISAQDHPWDDGDQIDVTFGLSPDDTENADPKLVLFYKIERSEELGGVYQTVAPAVIPDPADYQGRSVRHTVGSCQRGVDYYFRVQAVGPDNAASAPAETTQPVIAI